MMQAASQTYHPVVLCGGVGSRLWPLSRAAYPKQFLSLAAEKTMLQETLARAARAGTAAAPILLCNEEHRFLVAAQAQEAGVIPDAIILEPEGRNTAPALALAALRLSAQDPQALMLVLPADHVIAREDAFADVLGHALTAARDGWLVTFGITPTEPNTGYGYIKPAAWCVSDGVMRVEAFVEKPDQATAEGFLASGDYHWNAGMFVFRADRYLAELATHAPDILSACRAAMAEAETDLDFLRPGAESFRACRSESIDYAVMEHSDHAAVAPCDLGWSDIGSWDQLWQASPRDESGNTAVGDIILEGATGCYVRSEDRLIAAVGVEDLIIISTPDVVMVAPRARAQDVKALVTRVKDAGRDEVDSHSRVYRPWGFYESVHNGGRHQVKHIQVAPGAKLSLQKHFHRAEHWVVVQGTAIVTRDADELLVSENESVYLPLGCVHRLENPGKVALSIVEVQTGAYLGEDDIVRFEDVYNRD